MYCLGPLIIILIFGTSRAPIRSAEPVSRDTDMPLQGFGVKALDGVHECVDPCRQPQMLLQDGFFWHACAVLTALVNILATTLIGYKAWCVTVVLSV